MKGTFVALVIISSLLANSANAGDRRGGIDPLWIPVAILSTLAAVAAVSDPPPVVYERRVYHGPRRTVIYEEPRDRHEHYYERGPTRYYRDERGRSDESPRFYEYR